MDNIWFSSTVVPQCSGQCSLYHGDSFALQERWDIPSLAASAPGTYLDPHTGSTCVELTQRKKKPKSGIHQSLSSSPKATCSFFLLLRAKVRFLGTSVGLFWGLRKRASPRGVNKWPPRFLYSHFLLKQTPSSHPAYSNSCKRLPRHISRKYDQKVLVSSFRLQ